MANQKALQKAAQERMASKKSGHYVGFKKLAKETGSPDIAAAIGIKKYGKAGFEALAHHARRK